VYIYIYTCKGNIFLWLNRKKVDVSINREVYVRGDNIIIGVGISFFFFFPPGCNNLYTRSVRSIVVIVTVVGSRQLPDFKRFGSTNDVVGGSDLVRGINHTIYFQSLYYGCRTFNSSFHPVLNIGPAIIDQIFVSCSVLFANSPIAGVYTALHVIRGMNAAVKL